MTNKTDQTKYYGLLSHYASFAPDHRQMTADDIEIDMEDLGIAVKAESDSFFMESICDSGTKGPEALDYLREKFIKNTTTDLTPSAEFLQQLGKIVFDAVELHVKKQLARDIECAQAERYSQ